MRRELRPLVRALGLQPITLGGTTAWRGAGVIAATVGVGPEMARHGALRVLEASAGSGASGVLVIGVAGACDPALKIADVLAPMTVVDAGTGAVFEPQPFLPGARQAGRAGVLATVPRIGAPVPPGASAVDMETAAIAAVCVEHRVAWDVRRAVSDLPGTLPATIGTVLRADGRTDAGALARLLLRRPADGLTLARLGRDASRAIAAATASALAALGADR